MPDRPRIGRPSGVNGRRPAQWTGGSAVSGSSGQHVVQGLLEHPAAGRVQARVPAGELDRAGDADPVAQRRQRRLAPVVDDRPAWRPVPATMANRERIALGRVDRQAETELPAPASRSAHRPRARRRRRRCCRPRWPRSDRPVAVEALHGDRLAEDHPSAFAQRSPGRAQSRARRRSRRSDRGCRRRCGRGSAPVPAPRRRTLSASSVRKG